MNTCIAYAIVTAVLAASTVHAQTEWTEHNNYLNFTRILVAGRVTNSCTIADPPTNGVSVAEVLDRAGKPTLPAAQLRVTICPKSAFVGPTNRTGVVSDLADSAQIRKHELNAGDSLFMHARNSASVGTNLQVLAIGELKTEGVVEFKDSRSCTIMSLIFKLGGMPTYAKTRAIRLIRMGHTGDISVRVVDAQAIIREGSPDLDIMLQDGDIVLFPRRQLTIF